MVAWRVLLGAGAAVVVLGVGAATAASPSPLPLSGRVLRAGEFLGFRPMGPLRVVRQARAWAHFSGRSQATLKKDGFVAGLREPLAWQARQLDGLSIVAEFNSAHAAQHEVTLYRSEFPNMSSFPVAGIPGAYGFADSGGENIAFASGPFQYLVGAGWAASSRSHPTRAQLTAAAVSLYRKVHGRNTA